VYIGFASELPFIAAQNPNLNFDVAKVPQASSTGTSVTFGNMQAIGVVKASKNLSTALFVASDLTSADFQTKLTTGLLNSAPVAPARRDLLATAPQTLFGPTLYSSAIISRGWYDPGAEATDPIFSNMVDSVVRGASDPSQAVGDAESKLTVLFSQ
jgi:ABC-type glycerol-3-phosphate transport system substrate-binding protein